jgi:hypothetical protein
MVLATIVAGAYAARLVWGPAATVQDGRYVEFRVSPDHDAIDTTGTAIVKGYALELFAVGGAAPVQTIDLGKPAPAANGVIRLELASIPLAGLTPGTTYEAAITAVGPYGSGESDRSNRFAFSAPR